MALKRADFCCHTSARRQTGRHPALLGAGVLGDGLRAFRDGVLGQLAGQKESDGRLDFAARDRRAAVVVRQTARLGGDAFEDVVDERVHDRHGLRRDPGVRMDLLQNLVDVDGVRLTSSPLSLLLAGSGGFRLRRGLLRTLRRWFRRHTSQRRTSFLSESALPLGDLEKQ